MSGPRVAIASEGWNVPRYRYVGTHIYTEAMLAAARSVGVDAYPLPRRMFHGQRIGGLVMPLAYQVLARYDTPDVVHQATPIASPGVDIVTIHDIRVFGSQRLADRFFRFETTLSMRLAKRVMVTTAWMGEEIRELLPWVREKLRVIPYPFETPPLCRQTPAAYDVLWISRLAPYKDPDLYLNLAAAFPEQQFAVRGSTWPGWESFAEALRARGPPNVTFLPLLSEEERDRLYRSVPILVSTSRYEGFHAPIMEGYIRGMKVILPRIQPYVEIYSGREPAPNVFWYEPKNALSLADAFRRATETETRAPSDAIVGRVSHTTVGRQLKALYEEAAA